MKKRSVLMVIFALAAGVNAQNYNTNRGFIHPGGIHTQEDFNRVKTQIATGNTTVMQAFNVLQKAPYAQSNATTYPVEVIIRGGGNGENYINAARGATIAYQNALMWKITGSKAYADHAVEVLMIWAKTTKSIGGDSNYALAAGLYGYQFAQAAELMRDYEGWQAEDFKQFKSWMLEVWYPTNIRFMRTRNGTWQNSGKWWQAPGHYWSNWGLCNALSILSIGVLCDDVFIYNQGLSYIKYDQVGTFSNPRTEVPIKNDGLTEYWGNLIVTTHPSDIETGAYGQLGQMQESGRDIGHATMAAGLAIDIAHLAWNQGDDLFSYMDNRLAAGLEYIAAQTQLEANLPWTNYIYGSSGYYYSDSRAWTMTAPALGSQIRPYWGTVIGHYEGLLGVKMPFAEKAYAEMTANGPDGGGIGSTSGGYDHLGYSVLMNTYNGLATAETAPTLLTPLMETNGKTIAHNELGGLINTFAINNNTGVIPGSIITLRPQLPAGEINTGQWIWDSGETSQDITIVAKESHIYRVTYTNNNGIKSSQCFSIAVAGDCTPAVITPSITYNNLTTTADSISVFYGDKVTLGIEGKDGYGTYHWSNGQNTATTTITVNNDTTLTATYKNQGGALTTQQFKINVIYLTPQISVNGQYKTDTTQVVAKEGDDIIFKPKVSDSFKGITFRWSNGTTGRFIHYPAIKQTEADTLYYTIKGKTDTLYYAAYLSEDHDSKIPSGQYRIRNRITNTYLTNNMQSEEKSVYCSFKAFTTEANNNTQVWLLNEENAETAGYSVRNAADDKYITLTNRLSDSKPTSLLFFRKAVGRAWYQIHNRYPYYWVTDNNGKIISNINPQPTNFPLELIPYTPTAINSASTAYHADDEGNNTYNIAGQRVNNNYKGIVIKNGRKQITHRK